MRQLKPIFSLILVLVFLILPVPNATGQDSTASTTAKADAQTNVNLQAPSWQAVLDRLFGTPDSGLLDGKKAFEFRANDVTLTSAQAAAFFNSSSTSSQDLAALIDAAIALHGQVRMEGTVDGKPFDFKLAGRELKLDGITLTTAQRESLSTELLGISGLHQAKIDAIVDGKATMIVLAGGKERISLVRGERPENARGEDKQKLDRPQKIDIEHRADIEHKVEIDHPRGADMRVEHAGRVEVLEKLERPGLGGK